jgi:hypothetical protein
MNITELPFNKLIGINLSADNEYLLCLEDKIQYTNHLKTVHASALFSLAEATSGHFLLVNFPEYENELIPVVRHVEIKYKKPANGQINSTATLIDNSVENIKEQLNTRKRASVKIKVDLFDTNKTNLLTSEFEWFVTTINTST